VAAPPALVQTVSCRPNPFNPRATIAFVVPTSGRVTLKVYDLRGRLVRQLLDEERPAGPGTVVWDGTDADGRACASGIYLHELRSGAGGSLGKMTLIR
jgi:flagellar hook assembly protein FlgD